MKTKLFILIATLFFCCSVHSQSADIDKIYNDTVAYYHNYIDAKSDEFIKEFKDRDFNKLKGSYRILSYGFKQQDNKSDISEASMLKQIDYLLGMYVISLITNDNYEDIFDATYLPYLIETKTVTLFAILKRQIKLKYQ